MRSLFCGFLLLCICALTSCSAMPPECDVVSLLSVDRSEVRFSRSLEEPDPVDGMIDDMVNRARQAMQDAGVATKEAVRLAGQSVKAESNLREETETALLDDHVAHVGLDAAKAAETGADRLNANSLVLAESLAELIRIVTKDRPDLDKADPVEKKRLDVVKYRKEHQATVSPIQGTDQMEPAVADERLKEARESILELEHSFYMWNLTKVDPKHQKAMSAVQNEAMAAKAAASIAAANVTHMKYIAEASLQEKHRVDDLPGGTPMHVAWEWYGTWDKQADTANQSWTEACITADVTAKFADETLFLAQKTIS